MPKDIVSSRRIITIWLYDCFQVKYGFGHSSFNEKELSLCEKDKQNWELKQWDFSNLSTADEIYFKGGGVSIVHSRENSRELRWYDDLLNMLCQFAM